MAQLPFPLPPLHNTVHFAHPTALKQIRKTSTSHHFSVIQLASCSCWPKGTSPAVDSFTPSSFMCSGLKQLHINCSKVTNCFVILEKPSEISPGTSMRVYIFKIQQKRGMPAAMFQEKSFKF